MIEELKNLVKQEADKLKELATKEELQRLSFDRINHLSVSNCIYGQMTGDCYSDRAIELLNNCANPFSESLLYFNKSNDPDFNFNDGGFFSTVRAFSPIEFYISSKGAKLQNLISYLNGETENLEL